MEIGEADAGVIMSAISVSFSEGIGEWTADEEYSLVSRFHADFPLTIEAFDWLPSVKRVIENG